MSHAAKRGPPDLDGIVAGHGGLSTAKKPRLEDATAPVVGIENMVAALDEKTVRSVLLQTAHGHGSVDELIRSAYANHVAQEQRRLQLEKARVLDLSHYSNSAWYILNKKYKSSKGSVEYERAFDAVEEVGGIVAKIEEQAPPDSSYGTKKSAMETLRKIGKSVMLSPSTLGSEVRKHMSHDSALAEAMYGILESMSDGEREELANSSDEKGTFFDKVAELASTARGYCMFEKLDDVLDLLSGEEEAEASDDEGAEEDDSEDGSDA